MEGGGIKILVTGGTGTVGSAVVKALLARRAEVSVLTRDAKKPMPEGATAIEGDLLDVGTVRRVFNGVDSVFLLNAVSLTETSEALMAISAMRSAGVEHIVYLSVHRVDEAPWLPHFGSKIGIEAALKKSGIAWTILRPNNFFQKHGLKASPEAIERQTRLIGRAPRSFEAFAAETAKAWQEAG